MDKIDFQEIRLVTHQGDVRIRSFCSPEAIRQCTFDRRFASHGHFKSLYTSRKLLEESAQQPDASVVLALTEQNRIIGYGVLAYPNAQERWAELGSKIMMEVTAIEVCRSWRAHKIAPAILKMMVIHPQIEEKIFCMVGYSWTWDLNGNRFHNSLYKIVEC